MRGWVFIAFVGGASIVAGIAAEETEPRAERQFLSRVRQLTFEGARAGEGYFSPDGGRLVFQSEREPGNPFYQIYLMDLSTGDVTRISPGTGKTTCAWIHPTGEKVLFASTHEDRESARKQTEELEFRASGQTRRYSWDYDEHFDLYETRIGESTCVNLTRTPGYDAEGSWSPDGQWIAFTSNRQAYGGTLTQEEQAVFENDQSYFCDIYLMRADGTDVKRLTDAPGYDGGPFFSPDGKRIAWRRFSKDGATAEIYTMNVDGTDQRQITRLGAMSWAPFYHPSGDYIIFATNKHGFDNFELYLVDVEGAREPIRVTSTGGFDGLPVFSPDGRHLCWTSNRTPDKKSQLFLARWDDGAARTALGLPARPLVPALVSSGPMAATDIRAEDIRRHVEYLASETLEGRLTGTPGETLATQYVAEEFHRLALLPGGGDGYFDPFEFTAGVSLGPGNRLVAELPSGPRDFAVDEQWRPLAFSATGEFDAPVVFAGYGLVAPALDSLPEYDSYVHLDVKDKWVMVLRYLPEEVSTERRLQLTQYAGLRHKAMLARDRGAKGIVIVTGPTSPAGKALAPLAVDGSFAGSSIAALTASAEVGQALLEAAGRNLEELQRKLDTGEPMMGFEIEGVRLKAVVDMVQERRSGRNVVARLQTGEAPSESIVLVGAHIDHLGRGENTASLARDNEKGKIHFGADDNASGVAGMLEIAEHMAALERDGSLNAARDFVFAAWSGEELGLLGSADFAREFAETHGEPLSPAIAAYVNMDMIGRLSESVILGGVGSSSVWPAAIERANAPVGLAISQQNDSFLPTDVTSFFVKGVPFLNAFTGAHEDYHSPRDTADKINYEGAADIARFMGRVALWIANRREAPDYIGQDKPAGAGRGNGLRAYLGTIPDYARGDAKGVALAGVSAGGPAAQAGLKGGDVVVELAGKKIENIYDYTYAIEAIKIGEPAQIVVMRDGQRLELEVTPAARE